MCGRTKCECRQLAYLPVAHAISMFGSTNYTSLPPPCRSLLPFRTCILSVVRRPNQKTSSTQNLHLIAIRRHEWGFESSVSTETQLPTPVFVPMLCLLTSYPSPVTHMPMSKQSLSPYDSTSLLDLDDDMNSIRLIVRDCLEAESFRQSTLISQLVEM